MWLLKFDCEILFFVVLDARKCHREKISKKETWSKYTSGQEKEGPTIYGDPRSFRVWDPWEEDKKRFAGNQKARGQVLYSQEIFQHTQKQKTPSGPLKLKSGSLAWRNHQGYPTSFSRILRQGVVTPTVGRRDRQVCVGRGQPELGGETSSQQTNKLGQDWVCTATSLILKPRPERHELEGSLEFSKNLSWKAKLHSWAWWFNTLLTYMHGPVFSTQNCQKWPYTT